MAAEVLGTLSSGGFRSLCGIEPAKRGCLEARDFAITHKVAARFIVGVAESLPFRRACFDCVISYDVVEHVSDVTKTLEECLRVLQPGRSFFAIFPPFHHPIGAHLEGWLSKMPWPNVIFPCHALLNAGTKIISQRKGDYRPDPLRPTDRASGVLMASAIRKLRRILSNLDAGSSIQLAPLFSPLNSKWGPWRMRYYAGLLAPLRGHLLIVQECFTHRIVLTVTKPEQRCRKV